MVEPSAWDSRSRFPTGMRGTGQAPRFRFWGGEEQSLEVAFKQLGGPYTTAVGTISRHIICSGQLFAQFFRSHPEELPEAQRGQLQAQQAVRRLILSVPGPELV